MKDNEQEQPEEDRPVEETPVEETPVEEAKGEEEKPEPKEEEKPEVEERPKHRKEGGWQRQIKGLQRAHEEARRTNDLLAQQNTMLMRALGLNSQEVGGEELELDPEQFEEGENDPRFIRALAERAGREGYRKEAVADRRTRAAQTEAERVDRLARELEALEAASDDELADPDDVPLTRVMERYLLEEDDPKTAARISHHLRAYPNEAWRISRLSPTKQILALGRIAETPTQPNGAGQPAGQRESRAPKPMTPVKGGGTGTENSLELSDDLPIEEWMRRRDLLEKRRA